MNEYLGQLYMKEEIMEALNQMYPTKAQGPDRFPVALYQKHRSFVKEGVIATCFHILNEACTIFPLNHTYTALIPKNMKLRKITEFRPISLYNVIYRIDAKTVANRLKTILHAVIDQSQSAFIPTG